MCSRSSIGHGIPPTINRRCYNVPTPTLESLVTAEASEATCHATMSFLHMCKLSQVLGDILPLVYSLQLDVEEIWRSLRKAECASDDWVEALPSYLRLPLSIPSTVDGSSNLWSAYLSTKVIICRLAFKLCDLVHFINLFNSLPRWPPRTQDKQDQKRGNTDWLC